MIELLVVIAIIGLLSGVATVALSSAGANARNQKRKADMVQVSKALDLYHADNGAYPSTGGNWYGHCSGYGSRPNVDPGSWIPGLVSGGYMAKLPIDPRHATANPSSSYSTCHTSTTNTCYVYRSNGTNYALLAYCTPEGAIPASDPFYERHNVGEYKVTSDWVATDLWY